MAAFNAAVPSDLHTRDGLSAGPEHRPTTPGIIMDQDGVIQLTDDDGAVVAYLPYTGDPTEAAERARLYAEAPRLLELAKFASRNLGDARPGLGGRGRDELLRAYLRCCADILTQVGDAPTQAGGYAVVEKARVSGV